MPIPFILAGLAVGSAAIGVGGHLSAKETNEKAQKISNDARALYDKAKDSLTIAQNATEKSLLKLGNSKKSVLDTSMTQFRNCYDRIKELSLEDSVGLDEIKNFTITPQEMVQIQEMTDIYNSAVSTGVAGAAAGTMIALAASGSLTVVTGSLELAGSALMLGEVGAAAGIAGSALSFGATMTPLAAVAAPVVLFTGVSASLKADENLEKAKASYAEAEAASEKMKVSETLCYGIRDRSDMFDDLLQEINGMFSECTALLDTVTKKKMGLFRSKKIKAEDLSEEDIKLIAVTRALAGAVKSVIDTPILTKDGELSKEAQTNFNKTKEALPELAEKTQEVLTANYDEKPLKQASQEEKISNNPNTVEYVRNSLSIALGLLAFVLIGRIITNNILAGAFVFSVVTLLIMDQNSGINLFNYTRLAFLASLEIEYLVFIGAYSRTFASMRLFVPCDIVLGAVFAVLCMLLKQNKSKLYSNVGEIGKNVLTCSFLCCVSFLLFKFLNMLIGLPYAFSIIVIEILFALASYIGCYKFQ